MNKATEEVKILLNESGLKIDNIVLIGNGYASSAYKISCAHSSYIALTPKLDCISKPDYAYYFSILKTLENISYEHSPRAVYINPQKTIIVMSLVPGRTLSWINNEEEIAQKRAIGSLIDALMELRNAPYETCNSIYKKLSGQDLTVNTLQNNADFYMRHWYEQALSAQPNQNLMRWVRPKVEKYIDFANTTVPSKNIILSHGDTTEGNVFLTKNFKINLIDWDTSRFNQYPEGWDDYGIGYLFNHVPMFKNNQKYVINLLSEKTKIPTLDISKSILNMQEMIMLHDIMWGFMMNARAEAGDIKYDPAKFLKITNARINEYQKLFTKESFLG